ncbi:MAG TPA: hypothetical protein DCQ77_11285 [Betaproteobacteria bacterium]|nr:hypothetical protein [Betaproteobacteria bacterium]
MSDTVPAELKPLAAFLEQWALPTESQRIARRLASDMQQLTAFHDAVLPHLRGLIETLNRYPLDALPAALKPYGYLALMMAEIDMAVSRFHSADIPGGFPLQRLHLVHEEDGSAWH